MNNRTEAHKYPYGRMKHLYGSVKHLYVSLLIISLGMDVPVLVGKYVKDNKGWPDLERAYRNAVRATKKKKK